MADEKKPPGIPGLKVFVPLPPDTRDLKIERNPKTPGVVTVVPKKKPEPPKPE